MNENKLGGLGFRSPHFIKLSKKQESINWLEVISENYVGAKGLRIQKLEKLRENYEIALHGVSLNIASFDDINLTYLKSLKDLINRIEPVRVSDHLCWTGSFEHNFHDLLPFPYTKKMLDLVAAKVNKVQDYLGRELILENLSSYVSFPENEMSEYEFIVELSKITGCFNLFDINNLYVNASNHGFDPFVEIEKIPISIIKQVHLAGFSEMKGFLVDTHSKKVHEGVWKLFESFYKRQQHIPFMIEWDADIPEYSVLESELLKGNEIISRILNE